MVTQVVRRARRRDSHERLLFLGFGFNGKSPHVIFLASTLLMSPLGQVSNIVDSSNIQKWDGTVGARGLYLIVVNLFVVVLWVM